jgi:hypothetical protein
MQYSDWKMLSTLGIVLGAFCIAEAKDISLVSVRIVLSV